MYVMLTYKVHDHVHHPRDLVYGHVHHVRDLVYGHVHHIRDHVHSHVMANKYMFCVLYFSYPLVIVQKIYSL